VSIRRRSAAIAVIGGVTGGIIGHELGVAGLGPAFGLGVWIALLGLGALLMFCMTLPGQSAAPSTNPDDTGWSEFRRELRRARRGGQPLTMLRVAGEELPSDGLDGRSDLGTRARRLALHLRLVDRTWVDDGSIYVLLPETTRAAAEALIGRVRATAPEQLPGHVHMATFPENGLTSGALIAAVNDGVVDSVPTPIRPTRAAVVEVTAFAQEDDLPIGEAAGP
jgi:hypothetical protein